MKASLKMNQEKKKLPFFLVIAHDQPWLLHSLVQRLSPNQVFIHLSLACDRNEFIEILGHLDNVHFLEEKDSFLTAWGGLNLVRAQLALGSYASTFASEQDYLVWISGRDYLIKPIDDFTEYLNSNAPRDYIGFFSINKMTPHYSSFITKRYFYDGTQRFTQLARLPNLFRRILNKLLNGRIQKSMKSTLAFGNREIVCGYPRFALRNSTFVELKKQLNNDYWAFFKESHAPDDMFIHSMFFNSKVRSFAQPGLTPFDSTIPENSVYATVPSIWCEEYSGQLVDDSALEHFKKCDAFFARKFDENISEKVLLSFENEK